MTERGRGMRKNIYERPRVEKLLDRTADCPLFVVAAGAGYGKTTAVQAWLKKSGLAWGIAALTCGDESLFWEKLCAALEPCSTALADGVILPFVEKTEALPPLLEAAPRDDRFIGRIVDACWKYPAVTSPRTPPKARRFRRAREKCSAAPLWAGRAKPSPKSSASRKTP